MCFGGGESLGLGGAVGMLGVGMSGLGALSAANTARANASLQKTQMDFNAQMAKINQQLNETNAETAIFAGQREEASVRLRTAQLKSTQRARIGASGVDISSDTSAAILTSTDMMGEIDAQTVANNALRQAWGYRTQGVNYTAQSAMASASGSAINPTSAYTNTLLGGAGSVAMNWYQTSKGMGITNKGD